MRFNFHSLLSDSLQPQSRLLSPLGKTRPTWIRLHKGLLDQEQVRRYRLKSYHQLLHAYPEKPKPVTFSCPDFPATISVDVPNPDFDGFYTAYVRKANGRPVYERNPTIPHLHRVIFVNRVNLWVISDFDHFSTGDSEKYQIEQRSTLLPTMKTWNVQQFGTYPYSYLGEEGNQFFHDKRLSFYPQVVAFTTKHGFSMIIFKLTRLLLEAGSHARICVLTMGSARAGIMTSKIAQCSRRL